MSTVLGLTLSSYCVEFYLRTHESWLVIPCLSNSTCTRDFPKFTNSSSLPALRFHLSLWVHHLPDVLVTHCAPSSLLSVFGVATMALSLLAPHSQLPVSDLPFLNWLSKFCLYFFHTPLCSCQPTPQPFWPPCLAHRVPFVQNRSPPLTACQTLACPPRLA